MMMLYGILPDVSKAETLLNNLYEADFDLADVSVIMQNVKKRDAFAQDGGPLKGATFGHLSDRLVQAGLSRPEAELYMEAVEHGKVLVVMTVTPEAKSAAREMFTDHSAELIKE
jgi:hypothetical protein